MLKFVKFGREVVDRLYIFKNTEKNIGCIILNPIKTKKLNHSDWLFRTIKGFCYFPFLA